MTGEDKDFDDFWMDCLGASALRLQFIDTTPSRNDKNCEEGTKIVISGFLAEHRDVWYFVTAGHCLLDIVEAQKRGQRLQQFHLSDRHNPKRDGPQQLIPFDFGDAEKFGNVDFDIGAIQLNDASRRILEAKRPRPLKLSDCRPISETDSVDTYLLLGTPSQYVHDLGFSVAAVHVEPIPRPADLTSDENRFYGKIHVNEAVDLDGCSGGPIFAVRRGTDGQLQFGLAGMQTAWFEESQVICATHGDYIFAYLEIIHTVERHNPAELIAVEDWARLEKLERIQQELLKNVKLDLMLPNWVRAQSSASKASILLPRPNSVKGHNSR